MVFRYAFEADMGSGVNLVWNLGVVGPGSKLRGSWVLKVQQMKTRGTELRVSFPEFLF